VNDGWDDEQERLQVRARELQSELGLGVELARLGEVAVTGSVALRVMVALDVDLTVTVAELGSALLERVTALAARMITRDDVREVLVRDDTGAWNADPAYPDGIYLRISARDALGEEWTVDVWFVDQPERQPDLAHVREFAPLVTPETQSAILERKRATRGLASDGTRLPSYLIYDAVLRKQT
jgi:hypothetical protein